MRFEGTDDPTGAKVITREKYFAKESGVSLLRMPPSLPNLNFFLVLPDSLIYIPICCNVPCLQK